MSISRQVRTVVSLGGHEVEVEIEDRSADVAPGVTGQRSFTVTARAWCRDGTSIARAQLDLRDISEGGGMASVEHRLLAEIDRLIAAS